MINTESKKSLPKVLLWGSGSLSRIVFNYIKKYSLGEVKIIYSSQVGADVYDASVLFVNNIYDLIQSIHTVTHFVVCVGSEHGYARVLISKTLERHGLIPIDIRDNSSLFDPSCTIGHGCMLLPRSVVTMFTNIGDYTIINTNSTVDHECNLAMGVHIMGGANITGRVTIDSFATVGTNSTILPDLTIGEGALVGANSLVLCDIPPYTLAYGVPARLIRQIAPICFTEEIETFCKVYESYAIK